MFTVAGFTAAAICHWVTIVTKHTSWKKNNSKHETSPERRPGVLHRCHRDKKKNSAALQTDRITSHSWSSFTQTLQCPDRTPDPMFRQTTAKMQTDRMSFSCRRIATTSKTRRRRRSGLVPGGGTWIGPQYLSNNPLYSIHSGHQWCQTDSCVGNNNPVNDRWFDIHMFKRSAVIGWNTGWS